MHTAWGVHTADVHCVRHRAEVHCERRGYERDNSGSAAGCLIDSVEYDEQPARVEGLYMRRVERGDERNERRKWDAEDERRRSG